ncbi:MAG: hypothetical protein IT221_10445 [Fluviicola sp.]|nr:hypothetical protein [Fluviicola sp.]
MNPLDALNRSSNKTWQKWSVAIKIIPFVVVIGVLKYLAHKYNWEVMELNALFSSLVAGTIFLIGFLISGVLSDYKESEKLPSELAASLRTLHDDTYTINRNKESEAAKAFMAYQQELYYGMINWFYKKKRTKELLKMIQGMNDYISDIEKEGVQVNFVVRLKNEQNALRKMVMRIDTIRDTDFIGSAYAIVEIMGLVIAAGLIIIDIEPFYASLFFTTLVTFLISYMFLLIHDLDNPFDYSTKGESGTEVSLKPLYDLEKELFIID